MTLLAYTDTFALSDESTDILQAVVILNGNHQSPSNAYILRKIQKDDGYDEMQALISEDDARHLITTAQRADKYKGKDEPKQHFIV